MGIKNSHKIPLDLHKEIKAFVEVCLKAIGEEIKAIILFGSVVRGKFDKDEDLDFCIVVEKYPEFDRKLGAKIMELCGEVGISHSVDPVFVTKEGLTDFSSPFTLEVLTDGIIIHGDYPLEELKN